MKKKNRSHGQKTVTTAWAATPLVVVVGTPYPWCSNFVEFR